MTRTNGMLLTAVAIAALQGVAAAQTLADPPDPIFGMIGVGAAQTLRIGVVAASRPCIAVLGFRDERGMSIGAGDQRVDLAEHNAAFHDLTPPLTRGRIEVRPVVQVLAGFCAASAAVFERITGRSTAHAHKHRRAPGGAGEIHFAPVGATPAQRLRLGVVCAGASRESLRCQGEMVFHDARGVELGAAVRYDLGPGEAAFRELRINVRRGEIITCVRPVDLGVLDGSVASVQVIEDSTDWTTGYIIPCI